MAKTPDPPKILIVEDDSCAAICTKAILSKLGYLITNIVATGQEAVGNALNSLPDLILMDIKLRGEMDGITAYERIRETVEIPVVYVSSFTDQDVIDRANLTKPSGYILKPYSVAELIESIELALQETTRGGYDPSKSK
jgi:two-component system, response regulator PdtaR